MKIDLAPFKQEKNSTCLPACLRIVLHHFGTDLPEETLAQACKTNKEGTSIEEAAKAVRFWDFDAIEFEEASLFDLVDHLMKGRPVIVALDVTQMPYGDSDLHAVVVCGLEENEVKYIDPGYGKEMSLDLMTFFNAWHSLGRHGLVIYPNRYSN